MTLKDLGIGSYLTTAICEGTADTMGDVYADILDIGKIFGVAAPGRSLGEWHSSSKYSRSRRR